MSSPRHIPQNPEVKFSWLEVLRARTNPQEPVGSRDGALATQGRADGGPCALRVWAQARLRATGAGCRKAVRRTGRLKGLPSAQHFGGEENHWPWRSVWRRNACLQAAGCPGQRRVGGSTSTMGCSGEPAPLRAGKACAARPTATAHSPSLCPFLRPCREKRHSVQ